MCLWCKHCWHLECSSGPCERSVLEHSRNRICLTCTNTHSGVVMTSSAAVSTSASTLTIDALAMLGTVVFPPQAYYAHDSVLRAEDAYARTEVECQSIIVCTWPQAPQIRSDQIRSDYISSSHIRLIRPSTVPWLSCKICLQVAKTGLGKQQHAIGCDSEPATLPHAPAAFQSRSTGIFAHVLTCSQAAYSKSCPNNTVDYVRRWCGNKLG